MEWNCEGREFFADGGVRTHRASLNFGSGDGPVLIVFMACTHESINRFWSALEEIELRSTDVGVAMFDIPVVWEVERGSVEVLPQVGDMQVPCPRELYIPRLWDRPACRWSCSIVLE